MVSGVGTVVSGTLMSGLVKMNQNLVMGPDEFGHFNPVQVRRSQTRTSHIIHATKCIVHITFLEMGHQLYLSFLDVVCFYHY